MTGWRAFSTKLTTGFRISPGEAGTAGTSKGSIRAEGTYREPNHQMTPNILLLVECVAIAHIALAKPYFEPFHPLCRAAMGKRVRAHIALRLALQGIVTYCTGSSQALL